MTETNKRPLIHFVTGGARSGKSDFAEQKVGQLGKHVGYIATAIPFDEGMEDRVKKHRERRPDTWTTFEAPYETAVALGDNGGIDAYLLDCLTILTMNYMFRLEAEWDTVERTVIDKLEADIVEQVEATVQAAIDTRTPLVMVTNELGMGIVPESRMSRVFRDIAGKVNQRAAALSDEAWLVVSGIPVKIKG